MDVKRSERLVAQLLSALSLGKIPEALRDASELWEPYREYAFAFPDAVLALCHNHFIASLSSLKEDQGEQRAQLAQRLLERFQRLPAEGSTPLVEVVSRRLLSLLREPVEGISRELHWALYEQASRFAAPSDPFCAPHLHIEDVPSPDTIALLSAADAGLTIYLMVAHASGPLELKGWLSGVYREHMNSCSAPPQVREALMYVAQGTLPVSQLYPLLLNAFSWATESAPALAFEWLAGLLWWERDPDVMRQLQNQIRRPLELRLELTVKLYQRQAALLVDEQGGERLGLKFLSEAATLAEALIAEISARIAKERTLADLESHARIALVLSDIYLALGDDLLAFDLLCAPLSGARRDAFSQRVLAPRVMRKAAALLERLERPDLAQELYASAIRASRLEFLGDENLSASMDTLLAYLQGGLSPELAFEALYAVIDHYRLWFLESQRSAQEPLRLAAWHRALRWLSGQVEAARHLLPYTPYLELLLYLELTACVTLDDEAPHRAIGYARALESKSAVTLCELHRLRLDARRERSGHLGAHRAPPLPSHRRAEVYRRVLSEGQKGGHGSIQRSAAIFYICESARALQDLSLAGGSPSARERELMSDIEVSVMECAMLASRGPLNHRAGPLDLLLPPCELSDLEAAQEIFLTRGLTLASYHLAHALRHITQRTFFHPKDSELLKEFRELHMERFYQTWSLCQPLDEAHYQRYDLLLSRNDSPLATTVELTPYSVLLEYKVFQGWLLAFAVHHDGKVITHKLSISEDVLTGLVTELNEALQSPDPRAAARVHELSEELYRLIISPFEPSLKASSTHRLLLASDGPLDHLPFCLLKRGDGSYLVQLFELMRVWVAGDSSQRPRASLSSHTAARSVIYASQSARSERVAQALGARAQELGSFVLTHLTTHELVIAEVRARLGLRPAQWLCLSAEMQQGGQLSLNPPAPACSPRALNRLLCDLDIDCLALVEPVHFSALSAVLCGALSATRVGVLLCHWGSPLQQEWLNELISTATHNQTPISYVCALTELRRRAIRDGRPPQEWAAMELYVADPVVPITQRERP